MKYTLALLLSSTLLIPAHAQDATEDQARTLPAVEENLSLKNQRQFEEALVSTYKRNPRIETQRRALEESNEQVSQAIGAFRPSVTTSFAKGRQRSRFDGSNFNYEDSQSYSLNFNQPLFLGGQNIFNYARTKDQVMANRHTLNAFTQTIMIEAVDAYMAVVESWAVLELSRNNAQVLLKQLDAAKNRFEVGDVTRTDVAQAEARHATARSNVINAEGDLESSLASFEQLTGFRPKSLPLALPRSIPTLPATLEQAIENALQRSPSLLASALLIDAAENDIGVAASSLLPQVSLQGIMQRDDSAGVLGNSAFDTDSITVNVSLPIYQNGSEYSRVRQSKLIAKRRGFEQQDTREELTANVVRAWETLQAAIATIEAQQETVRAAEVALEGVTQEQQYGSRTVLDVLDAEQELFSARVQLVQARRQRYVSSYNLLQIIGDLTPQNLNLGINPYDAEEHYDDVKWQLIGF